MATYEMGLKGERMELNLQEWKGRLITTNTVTSDEM